MCHPLVDSLIAVQALSGSGIGKVKLVPVLLEKVVLSVYAGVSCCKPADMQKPARPISLSWRSDCGFHLIQTVLSCACTVFCLKSRI